MALFKATQVASGDPLMNADGANDTIALVGDFTIPAGFAANDVVEMVGLPAGYVPVDVIVDNASLGGTVTADVGILTGLYNASLNLAGAARDCGAEFIAASALGTAGIKRMAAAGSGRIAPTWDVNDGTGRVYDRGLGFKATAVTSPTVGAAVRMTVLARPMLRGA